MSFDDIYRQYDRTVRTRVLRIVGPVYVEDATQEAWLKIWRKLHTYKGEAALSSWLYRVATNAALDSMRRRRRRMPPGGFVDVGDVEDQLQDPSLNPEARHHATESHAVVSREIDRLPDIYRCVVLAVCRDGLSGAEASQRLHITPETVKSRLHRGRRRLTAALSVHTPAA